jgi:hypothetical protein
MDSEFQNMNWNGFYVDPTSNGCIGIVWLVNLKV